MRRRRGTGSYRPNDNISKLSLKLCVKNYLSHGYITIINV